MSTQALTQNRFSANSQAAFVTLHPDLQTLMLAVLAVHDCSLIQGHRTRAQHEELLTRVPAVTTVGYHQTMHRFYPSLAIDAIPYIPGRDQWDHQQILYFIGVVVGIASQLFEQGAMTHRIRVGADWDQDNDISQADTTFFDGPHIELVNAEDGVEDMSR